MPISNKGDENNIREMKRGEKWWELLNMEQRLQYDLLFEVSIVTQRPSGNRFALLVIHPYPLQFLASFHIITELLTVANQKHSQPTDKEYSVGNYINHVAILDLTQQFRHYQWSALTSPRVHPMKLFLSTVSTLLNMDEVKALLKFFHFHFSLLHSAVFVCLPHTKPSHTWH